MTFPVTLMLTTLPNADAAQALASAALAARVAACVAQGPVHSQYRWQGALETADEIQLLFKTSVARAPELERFIQARHPYETPEILSWQVQASPAYGQWIQAETQLSVHV